MRPLWRIRPELSNNRLCRRPGSAYGSGHVHLLHQRVRTLCRPPPSTAERPALPQRERGGEKPARQVGRARARQGFGAAGAGATAGGTSYQALMGGKTLAAVLTKPRTIELRELPLPRIDAESGLAKVEITGVCGADWPI